MERRIVTQLRAQKEKWAFYFFKGRASGKVDTYTNYKL
jgi:hypothetical protein